MVLLLHIHLDSLLEILCLEDSIVYGTNAGSRYTQAEVFQHDKRYITV